MVADRAFVYVACGSKAHVLTLQRSLDYLRPRTALPIIVVTDASRNECPIAHDDLVDVRAPTRFDHHQASIFLKTSLHRILPAGREYAYLDTDIIAIDSNVDAIFEHRRGPIAFAPDLTSLAHTVATFSPWALNCGCRAAGLQECRHLTEAILAKFGVGVSDDWLNWNGGVFVFGDESRLFMDTWHDLTMAVFRDAYWKTRDQGTLIATVWKLGLQWQGGLPHAFNFIVDAHNNDLRFDRTTGYTVHETIPPVHPSFLHLYHQALDRPGWTLARDVEDVLDARIREHTADANLPVSRRTLQAIAAGLAPRLSSSVVASIEPRVPTPLTAAETAARVSAYQVIVGLPRWTIGGDGVLAETLVRGLNARNIQAQVLLTEDTVNRYLIADPPRPRPSDIQVVNLPVPADCSWGTAWGALVRFLEERAPCVYVPIGDWRHSTVAPRLSSGVAIVGIVRNDDPRSLDETERLGRYWDAVVTPSATLAEQVERATPGIAGSVWTIHPGVADNLAAPSIVREDSGGALRVIYCGRLAHDGKRMFDLIRVAELLTERRVPFELTVVGDGPDRESFLRGAADLIGRGAIRWVGPLPRRQALEELRRQSVFLLVSERDGIPHALIEAMACGCVPVVSDSAGGVASVVAHGVNGYRVPVGQVSGYVGWLERLYRDPEHRRALSEASVQAIHDGGFDIETMVGQFARVFDQVVRDLASGARVRPRGLMRMPPYQAGGLEVMPTHYASGVAGVGMFPSYRSDYDDFRRAVGAPFNLDLPEWRHELHQANPVVMARSVAAGPIGSALAAELRRLGLAIEVLGAVDAAIGPAPWRSLDALRTRLSLGRTRHRSHTGGAHIERFAPCIFMPGDDEEDWKICASLPPGVGVVVRLDHVDGPSLERIRKTDRHCHAIVATNPGLAARLRAVEALNNIRIVTIPDPCGVPIHLPVRPLEWDTPTSVAYVSACAGETAALSVLIDALGAREPHVVLTAITDPPTETFERFDVVLMSGGPDDRRTHLVRAMSRGCVPVVVRGDGYDDLVSDGENGYVLADATPDAIIERLTTLARNPAHRRVLSVKAFDTIVSGGFAARDVASAYLMLFEQVRRDVELTQ